MVFFETIGDNDFAAVFESVAAEKRLAEERAQADLLLKLLDQMEEREAPAPPRVEFMRVGHRGDIIRDDPPAEKRAVMQLHDLPRESEFDLLFGAPRPLEPQLKVETGLRLRDGKEFQTLMLTDPKMPLVSWSGVRYEVLLVLLAVGLLLFAWAQKQRARANRAGAIEQEVQRRVEMRAAQIRREVVEELSR